jgi:hypothetical protein
VSAVWVFLPVLGGALAHAPVLNLDLLKPLKRPLDGGATLRGRRLFGDNKTWRGAIFMSGGVLLATLALSAWPWYWDHLPREVREASPLLVGTLLGLGTVLGELPNSFLKRQLDIEPGSRRRSALGIALAVFDQGDFVLGIWLALAPVWMMTPPEALLAFAVVAAVHSVINVVGYAIGAREAPV